MKSLVKRAQRGDDQAFVELNKKKSKQAMVIKVKGVFG